MRRITGGGAIYLDEGQLGWGLVFHRRALGATCLAELARDICQAVAAGLRRLGVEARYRPRNDIEVDGRKISGTGGFFDGDTLIYQGTVLVDMDPGAMVAALRVPRAKLEKRQLDSAAQRVVTLRELLGPGDARPACDPAGVARGVRERFDLEWRNEPLRPPRSAGVARYRDEIGTDEFVAQVDDPAHEADFLSEHTLARAAPSRATCGSKAPRASGSAWR